MFTILRRLGCWLMFLHSVLAIECSKHNILSRYRIDEHAVNGYVLTDTPPSQTNDTWWIDICDEHRGETTIPEHCNVKDVLCGITLVSLPGKEPLITQVMDFTNSVAVEIKEQDGLDITLSGASWGSHSLSAHIALTCDDSKSEDSVTESKWKDFETLELKVRGPSACLKNGSSKPPKDDNSNGDPKDEVPGPKGGAGLGSWLAWLFMYAMIFGLIYLIVTSYMNTRNGSFNDFRDEFVDRSTTFATNLPHFAKEVVGKIINSGSSSQRGGYSAV